MQFSDLKIAKRYFGRQFTTCWQVLCPVCTLPKTHRQMTSQLALFSAPRLPHWQGQNHLYLAGRQPQTWLPAATVPGEVLAFDSFEPPTQRGPVLHSPSDSGALLESQQCVRIRPIRYLRYRATGRNMGRMA